METTTTRVTGIDATYYTVADLDACTAFYAKVFGCEATSHAPKFYSEWTFDDGNSFGLYNSEQKPTNRSGSAMFHVDDINAAAEHLKSLGALVEHGESAVNDFPTCMMVFATDPEGNSFILHKRKA